MLTQIHSLSQRENHFSKSVSFSVLKMGLHDYFKSFFRLKRTFCQSQTEQKEYILYTCTINKQCVQLWSKNDLSLQSLTILWWNFSLMILFVSKCLINFRCEVPRPLFQSRKVVDFCLDKKLSLHAWRQTIFSSGQLLFQKIHFQRFKTFFYYKIQIFGWKKGLRKF